MVTKPGLEPRGAVSFRGATLFQCADSNSIPGQARDFVPATVGVVNSSENSSEKDE